MKYKALYQTPVGNVMLASDGESLVGLWLEGQKYFAQNAPSKLEDKDDLPVFESTKNWLDRYFDGKKPAIDELPLAPMGSDFRQKVFEILVGIPYGSLTTYGDIAKKLAQDLGKNVSAQAVGGAVGHNPISIIVPCHRVVGANGSLTGYAAGLQIKQRLLTHEQNT